MDKQLGFGNITGTGLLLKVDVLFKAGTISVDLLSRINAGGVIITLNPDAESIHKESLVIDSLFPTHLRPMGYTEKMRERMEEMLKEDRSASEIMKEMTEIFNQQLYQDETDYWSWWDESGVDVIHTTLGEVEGVGASLAYDSAITEIAGWNRRFDTFDRLAKITSGEDIRKLKESEKNGVILGFQNTYHLMGELEKLDLFYDFGIRIIQLTYNLRNKVGDGCTERTDAGLSEFGLKVVNRMNELGMLIDLSHVGYRTTMDAIEASDDPVAFTHTFCQSIHDHDRGKKDEEMEALAQNDGYMGILLVPDFLSSRNPSLEDFLDHLEHAVDILGIDRVGIGTDAGTGAYEKPIQKLNRQQRKDQIKQDGISDVGWRSEHFNDEDTELENYRDFRDFPNLTAALMNRGYAREEIEMILGENFLRIFQEVTG